LLSFKEPSIIYDRLKSKTGRLVVESGPKILLLKKEYRNIIKSRYGDSGKIMYLDYAALETRIMLQLAGKVTTNTDIYASLSKIIFDNKLSRDATKKIILAIAYGMSITTIAHDLGIEHKQASIYYDDVCNYLDKSKLENLAHKNLSNGILKNYYGRKIIGENNILNSYVQSTGVDVALLGFNNIITTIQENKFLMHPLYILHDALIIDCHNSFVPYLDELINAACTVQGFDCIFPIHVEQII
jgi:DNA polymerase I-like protein with 3'-5' exonuclease and polymerase domains